MKTVPLHGEKAAGRVALVDDADYDAVMQHRWHIHGEVRDDRHVKGPYVRASIKVNGRFRNVLLHKFLTGYPRTDHIDHNGLNNQRSNLREVTPFQNMHNRRKPLNARSRFKGVWWHEDRRRWVAHITANGKRYGLGRFKSELDAARAYNAAAIELHGEFACHNDVEAV
jgi:hypothetical protein